MELVNDSNCEIQNINKSDKHTGSEDNGLIQLVTCEIHKGILEDPRKLSCQHVFCYNCLEKTFDNSFNINTLRCQICRKDENISYVNQLRLAVLENQLLKLICIKKYQKNQKESEDIVEDNDLIQLVTCAIHGGILENPQKLSCQHAFCYECLKKMFDNSSETEILLCPTCNDLIDSDVKKLQSAWLEKQLLELICKKETKMYNLTSVKLSDKEIERLLLKKPRDTDDGIIDPITIEYMHANTKYECVKEYSINILQNISQEKTSNVESEFTIFDIFMIDGQPESIQLVLLDCKSSEIVMISESKPGKFYVEIEKQRVKPEYIRIYWNTLILSGKLAKDDLPFSVFLQCDLNGEILHKSELIPWLDPSGISMMLGFDIDQENGHYYLTMPQSQKVAIYNSSMIQSDFYTLHENKPEYVAICFKNNQLLISCAQNKHILILNRETKYFQTIDSCSTIPKMIFCFNDKDILYFDTKTNRLIWVTYLKNGIHYVPLELSHEKRDFIIKSIQILPSSQIIINTGNEILMFQNAKSISKLFRIRKLCYIL